MDRAPSFSEELVDLGDILIETRGISPVGLRETELEGRYLNFTLVADD